MASDAQAPDQASSQQPFPGSQYSWYVVFVLMIVYVFSFLDRTILGLLVEPIERDLGITDTQMSLLLGFSFAAFYAIMGIPLGRVADTYNRRNLIAAGLAVWSVMTAGCGLAKVYWQFFLLRMGVGVGEATLSPAAYSMISDFFPKEKLARALSVYSMGIFLGVAISTFLGGMFAKWASTQDNFELDIIGTVYPWQLVFIIIGLGGIIPMLLLVTVREPARRGAAAISGRAPKPVPVREIMEYMKANWKTLACHHLGFAVLAFSSYGVGGWAPTFMIRVHEWPVDRIGALFALHVLVTGSTGILAGGIVADRLLKKGYKDAPMIVGLIGAVLYLPFGASYPLVENGWVCWGLMGCTYFFVSFPTGAAAAALMHIMPNPMRGQAAAFYLFVVNLIGMGLGPTGVALLTDHVFQDKMKVGYSMIAVGVSMHLIAIAVFWIGLKHYRESVDRLERWERDHSVPN